MDCCKRFLKDETGAVTVDWVVLTAGVVVFAAIVMPPIRDSVFRLGEEIGVTIGLYGQYLE